MPLATKDIAINRKVAKVLVISPMATSNMVIRVMVNSLLVADTVRIITKVIVGSRRLVVAALVIGNMLIEAMASKLPVSDTARIITKVIVASRRVVAKVMEISSMETKVMVNSLPVEERKVTSSGQVIRAMEIQAPQTASAGI